MTRHLAIGDIHGCFNALEALMDAVQPGHDDLLIPLGDYCDRGPNSAAVLDWLIACDTPIQPLRGNHDIMMLEAATSDSTMQNWLHVGGRETLDSYSPFEGTAGRLVDVPDSHWSFLQTRLRPYVETATHFFVHANAYPDLPLADQPDYMLYWEKFSDQPRHDSGKIMVCGHTSQRSGLPLVSEHAICIDTRCYDGGWLTCLEAGSGKIWQANEERCVREFYVDEI